MKGIIEQLPLTSCWVQTTVAWGINCGKIILHFLSERKGTHTSPVGMKARDEPKDASS